MESYSDFESYQSDDEDASSVTLLIISDIHNPFEMSTIFGLDCVSFLIINVSDHTT